MRRTRAVGGLLSILVLSCCCTTGQTPAITRVVPANPLPGSLLLISGQGFARTATVRIQVQGAGAVTWVNARLLTAIVPLTASSGPATIEIAVPLGRRVVARDAVQIAPTAPPAATAVPAPAASAPAGTGTPAPGDATASASPTGTPVAQPGQDVGSQPPPVAPRAPGAPAGGGNPGKGKKK
jgi:hypothetical protein